MCLFLEFFQKASSENVCMFKYHKYYFNFDMVLAKFLGKCK